MSELRSKRSIVYKDRKREIKYSITTFEHSIKYLENLSNKSTRATKHHLARLSPKVRMNG